jgi:hypothetical protein
MGIGGEIMPVPMLPPPPPDTRMAELDELIASGWGRVPQGNIPRDWRTRKPPASSGPRKVSARKHRRSAAANARAVRWDRVRRQEHEMVVEALARMFPGMPRGGYRAIQDRAEASRHG